jgi:DNA-binding CsgD family transcriptional regulator/tetratricopeptide (TPR) repeat protein
VPGQVRVIDPGGDVGIDDLVPRPQRPVGREAEIRRILDRIARDGVAFVRGAAGIGKSLLLQEVGRLLRSDGSDVIYLSGTEATAVIPLAPLLRLCPPGAEDAGTAVMAALYRRSRHDRTVVLVDDAHLLDAATAAIVRQMVSAPAIGVGVAVRSGEPEPVAVESIHRDGYATVLELTELNRSATHRLVEQLLGPTDDETLSWIWTRTRGHPLYLRELVVAGRQTGALQQRNGRWHAVDAPVWTVRLHALVATRLRGLSPDERQAMELVAVGGTVPLGALSESVDIDVLVELASRRLLVIEAGRVRMDHPLIGETLLATMRPAQVVAARLRLADALEAYADDRDPVAIARLRLDAGHTVRPELLEEAVLTALRSRLPEVAERLARVACEKDPGAATRMRLVESLAMQRRWDEAEAQFEHVLAELEEAELAARLERWVMINFEYRDELAISQRIAARALELVGDRGAEVWQVLSLRIRLFTEDLDAAIDAHDRWLATHQGDPRLLEMVLVDIATCASHSGAFERVSAAVAASTELGYAADPVEQARLRGVELMADAWTGGIPRMAGKLERLLSNGSDSGDADVELLAHLHAGMAYNDLTRHAQAAEHLLASMDLGHYARHRRHVPLALAELARACLGTRRPPQEAAAWLARAAALREDARWVSEPVIQLARSLLDAADGSEPWHALDRGLDHARRRSARIHEVALLRQMAVLGRPERSVERLRELAGEMDGGLTELIAREAEARAARDAEVLDGVVEEAVAFGAVGLAADSAAHAASLHAGAGRVAAAFASQYRCDAVLAGAPEQRCLEREGLQPVLSPRELQVVEAVVAGASNREVAERLYISHRTVESHLRRIYRHLGIAGREELLALLEPGAPAPTSAAPATAQEGISAKRGGA